jgi:uncharacterized lipoprotein
MTVKGMRLFAALAMVMLAMTACGGDKPVARSCDEHVLYKEAREHRRIEAPEDMSPLDPEKEMPVPEPSPQPGRATDAPCLDLPPVVLGPEEQGDEEVSEESSEEAGE